MKNYSVEELKIILRIAKDKKITFGEAKKIFDKGASTGVLK